MRLRDYQAAAVEQVAAAGGTGLLACCLGSGKGLVVGTPVCTPRGWVPVERLRTGDLVIGSNGCPTRIKGVFFRGEQDLYRITFRDGASVTTDADHLWFTTQPGNRSSVRSTGELARIQERYMRSFRIPYTSPVQYPARNLSLPPYMLGGLLADGYMPEQGTITWTKNDQSVIDEMARQAAQAGYTLAETTCRTSTARHFRFARAGDSNRGTAIRSILGDLGLIGCKSRKKFIPSEYLTASVEQRRELLAGLMDGDGSVRKDRGTAKYCTTSRKLAEDVRELCWSLGVDAKIVPIQGRIVSKCFDQVIVRGSVNPFGAHPDKDLFTGGRQPTHRSFYRMERAGRAETVCLAVEAEDKLFVAKDTWLPTTQ